MPMEIVIANAVSGDKFKLNQTPITVASS